MEDEDEVDNKEAVMRNRLSLLANKIEEFSNIARQFYKGSNLESDETQEAHICATKLEAVINRFTTGLNEYFRVISNPAPDQIATLSEMQLNGEEILIELKYFLNGDKNKNENKGKQKQNTFAAKLPTLTLPEFDGDILKWCEYYDIFKSNIHQRQIADVDKLLYLKSTLKGEPRKIIDGLETTNKNYAIAIQILEERYGKSSQIIDAHYRALSKIKSANTINESREILNELERHLRVLKSLGEDTSQNHLRHIITEKFPEDIIYEVKMKVKEDTIEEIRKQLEVIISAKEESSKLKLERSDTVKEDLIVESMHTTEYNKPDNRHFKGSKHNRNFTNKSIKREDNTKQREFKRSNYTYKQNPTSSSDNHSRKRSYEESREREDKPNMKRTKYNNYPKRVSCAYCRGTHFSDQCRKYENIKKRKDTLKNRCYSCLGERHTSFNCRNKRICVYCQSQNHHRSLCPVKFKVKEEVTMTTTNRDSVTMLQTAVVTAINGKNENHSIKCRVLLDCGSQRSYITQDVSKKLKLPIIEENKLSIFSFASKDPINYESNRVKVEIITKTNKRVILQVNEVPTISTGVIPPNLSLNKYKDKILSDDGSLGDQIDILIGNDYYFNLVSTEKLKLNENLFLIESDFGYLLSGMMPIKEEYQPLHVVTYCQSHDPKCAYYTQPDLPLKNMDITFLWSLESLGITDNPKATREEEAIKHFNETAKYENGRYAVKWPWIQFPPDLPTNFGLAYGRLKGLLQRLQNDTMKEYENILNEQLKNGIIEIVEPEGNVYNQRVPPIHYLAHHIVKQEGKKGRIVYDASGKLKEGKSLNENMYRGPSLIGDLLALLIQFRTHKIAITADVEKAFLQIQLQNEDRDVTRFLWIKNVDEPLSMDNIIHMRFCRVPFGIIASPFILTATLKYHVSQTAPDLVPKIVDKCYVDNFVTGTETTKEAIKLYETTQKIFKSISMNMRDWISNDTHFIRSIPPEHRNKDQKETKLLGLIWNTETDTLKLNIKDELLDKLHSNESQSKRKILSTIASIYDPCGIFAPLILPIKLLLQELWNRKVKWDTNLPDDLQEQWKEMAENLKHIKHMTIPRYIGIIGRTDHTTYELHVFSDSSKHAYGTVAYLRTENKNKINTAFVMAKSKVVPKEEKEKLKMPKLELLGCFLGNKVIMYIRNNIELPISREFMWTDSQIVLCWFKSDKLLPPFYSRRINTIKENTNLEMRYIRTDINPADLATRPEMWDKKKTLWLEGPDFLKLQEDEWPDYTRDFQTPLGEGPSELLNLTAIENRIPEIKFQEQSNEAEKGNKEEEEVIHRMQILKELQRKYFQQESEGKKTSLAINLDLFKDIDGLLRCNGRMKNADWPFDKRHPILVPRDCEFIENLIMKIHKENYHIGANHTLSKIRELYWIPKGKSYIQRLLRKCPECIKHSGGPFKLPSAPALPAERVSYTSPFTYVGVDYMGPLMINNETGKCKRWICLYTCLVVRAIHLEVVADLTAEESLMSLRRMISTRGVPTLVISDNAQNFKLLAETVSNQYCIDKKIKWKFITPLTPWAGGFYERLVGIVKNCLIKTLGKHKLNDTQLATVIKEIEAVVNSRPLTSVDSELDYVLKPSDFLTVGKVITVEESDTNTQLPSTSNTKTELIKGWKRALKILEEFKQMFNNRYLLSLRERYNHLPKEPRITSKINPATGQIVQIKGESKNRNDWKVGKIISLIPSSDGQCRAAKVRVDKSEYVRSIAHLYPLEIEGNTNVNEDINKKPPLQNTATHDTDDANPEPMICDPLPNQEIQIKETTPEINIEPMKTSENEDTPVLETELLPKTNECHNDDSNQRPRRNAAIKALQKMKEWTNELNTLLLLSDCLSPPGSVAKTARF